MYHNIPLELRQLRQWVCWRYEEVNGRKTKVPYCPAPYAPGRASVHNSSTWGTFDEAVSQASGPTMDGIGMVLTEDDPYTGIDIDDKQENPASPEEKAAHIKILESFQSYTERSVGGRGFHIIIKGKINGGRDRGHVGVYSTARYLTFSGEVVRNAPIAEYQDLLTMLVQEMPARDYAGELDEVEGHLTDRELHERALAAVNGQKYAKLCAGEVTYGDTQAGADYTSNSESDLALISILAFYTRDNEQVRRMFRYTVLGKRQKHQDSNRWIDRCLRVIRSKQIALSPEQMINISQMVVPTLTEVQPAPVATLPELSAPAPVAAPAPAPALAPGEAPAIAPARAQGSYTPPPGLIGDLARYFFSTAVRPLQEASLAAAIGIVAGVAGRSYNISGTGLNQYLLFLAGTGAGKEGIAKGIANLIAATRPQVPMLDDFIGPSAFASGQALVRTLDQKPCFLSILGEFGLTLRALNDPRAPAPTVILRKVLLDLYGKSGWNDILQSTAYSDQEKNTKMVQAPNMSIIAESTPETFYEGIDLGDVSDGLIPRFHIIEYTGGRQPRNKQAGGPPSLELVQRFADLCGSALASKHNNTCSAVQVEAEALDMLDAFDRHCDAHLNSANNSGEKQLWNRGHLKALKLAGLVAVGINPHAPCVTAEVAQWAIDFTLRNTEHLMSRFSKGEVGLGESKQISDVKKVIMQFFKLDEKQLKAYSVKKEVQAAGLIPYRFLATRLANLGSFRNDRRGSSMAAKNALDQLVQMDMLSMLNGEQAMQKLGTKQVHYGLTASWLKD